MFQTLTKDTLVPLVLRLSLAAIFILHGVDKIVPEGKDAGASWATKEWRDKKDLRPAALESAVAQFAVAWGELLGGAALALGLLTRVAAAGLIVIQAGAIWTVTGMKRFSLAEGGGGWEYNFALLAMCLTLVLLGGGVLAADRLFHRVRRKRHERRLAQAAPA